MLCSRRFTYNWRFSSTKVGITGLEMEAAKRKGFAQTYAVVDQLTQSLPYTEHDYVVYLDNLFTTIPLLLELRRRNVGACDITRGNAYPAFLVNTRPDIEWNESSDGAASDGVLGVQWEDQKSVRMLSTVDCRQRCKTRMRKNPKVTSTNDPKIRKHFASERIEVDIPEIIDDYNYNKGGVDIAGQYHQYYFTRQTTRRN